GSAATRARAARLRAGTGPRAGAADRQARPAPGAGRQPGAGLADTAGLGTADPDDHQLNHALRPMASGDAGPAATGPGGARRWNCTARRTLHRGRHARRGHGRPVPPPPCRRRQTPGRRSGPCPTAGLRGSRRGCPRDRARRLAAAAPSVHRVPGAAHGTRRRPARTAAPCATADAGAGWPSGSTVVAVPARSRIVPPLRALAGCRQRQGDADRDTRPNAKCHVVHRHADGRANGDAQGDAGGEGNASSAVLGCHDASAGYPGRRQSAPATVHAVFAPGCGVRRFFGAAAHGPSRPSGKLGAPAASRSRMNTIMVPVSVGELVDKITILEIKAERIADPDKRANDVRELEGLLPLWERTGAGSPELDALKLKLRDVNERMWDVQDALRAKEAAQDFGAEFIELARAVATRNGERVGYKNDINRLAGSQFIEEKQYR